MLHVHSYIPVEKWTNENLNSWLSITEKGRFANSILPSNLDGKGFLSLNRNKLSALCQGTLRLARNDIMKAHLGLLKVNI